MGKEGPRPVGVVAPFRVRLWVRGGPLLLALIGTLIWFAGPAFSAQLPVYVYHEPGVGGYGYLDAPKQVETEAFHLHMAQALVGALTDAGFTASVIDAKEGLRICNERRRCVIVDICQYPSHLLFAGQEGSPIAEWLRAGGIMVYSGDWPFFWYVGGDGKTLGEGANSFGDDKVFGADLVREGFVDIAVAPTDAGKKWLPSLSAGGTMRPFDADAVAAACPWHEFYSLGKRTEADGTVHTAADALCFRVPKGDGFFAAFHLRRGSHTDTNQIIYEFLTKRLAGVLAEGGKP